MTTGIPINANNLLHSSLCSFVTLTCLLASLSISSAVPTHQPPSFLLYIPVSLASSSPSLAFSLPANRFASYTQLDPIPKQEDESSPHHLLILEVYHRICNMVLYRDLPFLLSCRRNPSNGMLHLLIHSSTFDHLVVGLQLGIGR